MLRKLVVILTMLLCSVATQVYALGLGSVTVESALNQPLRVRIELLQLGDTRLRDVIVQIASAEDFQRFNIDRIRFLSNIRFSVEASPQGNVVLLTSFQVVREPFLSFILETRWPSGRLLSEHTVLLDLPVFNDQQATPQVRQPSSPALQAPDAPPQPVIEPTPIVRAPITPPPILPVDQSDSPADPPPEQVEATETEQSSVDEPAIDTEEAAVEQEPAAVEEVAATEPDSSADTNAEPEEATPATPAIPATIEVLSGDTLSGIALEVRPDGSVTMQQTMVAIQQLNPDAFIGGNINRLRSGEVLRIPTLAEIEAIDSRQAVEEVSLQNQQIADTQPITALAPAAPDQDATTSQGQLSVLNSDDDADAAAGGGPSGEEGNVALDQRIAELESQLALRMEDVDRARIEREELNSRLAELESQIAAAQEIIRLQDVQLAQLQESLAESAAQAQMEAERQAAIAAAEPVQESPPTGFLGLLMANSMLLIGGVGVIILLLVVMLLRRNRASKLADGGKDFDNIAEREFEAAVEDGIDDNADSELQGYDDLELDEAIVVGKDDSQNDDEQDSPSQADADQTETEAADSAVDDKPPADTDTDEALQEKTAEADTQSFLDDLGIDLESFGDDIDFADRSTEEEKQAVETSDLEPAEPGTVELTFDLGADDAADAEEIAAETDESAVEDSPAYSVEDNVEDAVEELDTGDDAQEPDMETFEFEVPEVSDEPASEQEEVSQESDYETMDFDADATATEIEAADDKEEEEDAVDLGNAVDFDFEKDESSQYSSAEGISEDIAEDIETYDFRSDTADTVVEKAELLDVDEAGAEADTDSLDFDLDEYEITEDEVEVDVDVGGEVSAGAEKKDETEIDLGVEFEVGEEVEDSKVTVNLNLDDEDGLEFLSEEMGEVDMLSSDDEAATKLELAYAYQKMGDNEGAIEILQEVVSEGSDEQIEEANKLLASLDDKTD